MSREVLRHRNECLVVGPLLIVELSLVWLHVHWVYVVRVDDEAAIFRQVSCQFEVL